MHARDPKFDPNFQKRLIAETVDVVDHYQALEVDDSVELGAIKKAYRSLVLKWHPDKHPTDRQEAERRIRGINEAYEVLSNPTKKDAYDGQRRSVLRRKLTGGLVHTTIRVKTDLPRESMLQPVGYPHKFVRYMKRVGCEPECMVQSRADAGKMCGNERGQEDFAPFFNATKLSYWWLPGAGNMVRIRADGISTDEFFGTPLKLGQAGGLNFAWRIDEGESEADSAVKLMEAARGHLNEVVNFNVFPSPYYEGAFRFEAAYRKGFFIAFKPPTGLRVMPYTDGTGSECIVDFAIVDFCHVLKFIEIEEVLRLAMQAQTGYVPLDSLKGHPDVLSYFREVLGRPVWDDEDFLTYFQGHSDTWEFHAGHRIVRHRTPEEVLGQKLSSAGTPEQVSQALSAAMESVHKLPWQATHHAFKVLAQQHNSEDISSVVACMAAKRKLVAALAGVIKHALQAGASDLPVSAIALFSEEMRRISSDPAMAKARNEALDALDKGLVDHIKLAERRGVPLDLDVGGFASLLAVPSMREKPEALLRLMPPDLLQNAPLPELLKLFDAATSFPAATVAPLLEALAKPALAAMAVALPQDTATAIKQLIKAGIAQADCTAALAKRAPDMSTGELASCLAVLADKAVDSKDFAAAASTLSSRCSLGGGLHYVPPDVLLGLAVGGTKTEALAAVLASATDAAAAKLHEFPVADVIRLLLATSKAKGQPVPAAVKSKLFSTAADLLNPQLSGLSTVEIIKVGLAASGETGRMELLSAAAAEAEKRFSDIQPAQLMLLTQALAPLGGGHSSMQGLVDHWARLLASASSSPLSADQLVKLSQVLELALPDLASDCRERFVVTLGSKLLLSLACGGPGLSSQSRELLEKQVRARRGVGLWYDAGKLVQGRDRCSRSRSHDRGAGGRPHRSS